jgi:hypothetical protein
MAYLNQPLFNREIIDRFAMATGPVSVRHDVTCPSI